MRRTWRFLFGAICALASLALGQTALASDAIGVQGTFKDTSETTTSFRMADGNALITADGHGIFTGGIFGSRTFTISETLHPDGTFNFIAFDVCTPCAIGGHSGSIEFVASGTGSGLSLSGHFTLMGGTGGLSDAHGEGTFVGAINPTTGLASGTYSGQVHFDPST